MRIVSSLLDFLSLEGIYPLLSLGVGVPIEHRVKPLLQAGVTARRPESLQTATTNEEDVSLLKDVALELSAIISSQDAGKGLQSLIEDRLLTDVVSACAELAYGPKTSDEQGRSQFHLLLSQLIEMYVPLNNDHSVMFKHPPVLERQEIMSTNAKTLSQFIHFTSFSSAHVDPTSGSAFMAAVISIQDSLPPSSPSQWRPSDP